MAYSKTGSDGVGIGTAVESPPTGSGSVVDI